MKILKSYFSTEFSVKGSRFLSELFPCENQNDARNIVKAQKQKYADATHVVHAFILGLSGEIMGMSDDGEPAGTAGRPALDVLKGSGCTNFVLTVTRWFGGTLLGTGGLVKAYGDGAKSAVQGAESENLFEEYVERTDFTFSCDYSLYQNIKHAMENYSVSDVNEVFDSEITVFGKIVSAELEKFRVQLKDLSSGKINI